MSGSPDSQWGYVLTTPARNEREALPALLAGMQAQELRPLLWLIVDDGSDDGSRQWLEQARAISALAGPEHARAANLRSQGAISAAQYDEAVAQWNVAEARQAEASAVAEHALVRAPFAGVVTAKLVDVGDAAMPGQPLLMLEAPGAFRFEARVPEVADARALSIGSSVPVRLDGLGRELAATVVEVQPVSDEATRTQLVKLALPRAPGLRSGAFGRLLLTTGQATGVTVPAHAVVRRGQLEGVFVVSAGGGSARLQLIRSARERDGRVEISAGLSGGELLVLGETADLVDGQAVEVVP